MEKHTTEVIEKFDAIVIGSGFGGSMVAYKLSQSGLRVAILEKGPRIKRGPENWNKNGTIDFSVANDTNVPYDIRAGGNKKSMGSYSCVGGPSLFYGGVSMRFREKDFNPPSEIVANSNAKWPIGYDDLLHYYNEAEILLNVARGGGIDPTEPQRSVQAYPQNAAPFAQVTEKLVRACKEKGLSPFGLPLAINFTDQKRNTCTLCTTCDTFTCAIGAKNDLETMILNGSNIQIFADTVVTNIVAEKGEVSFVEAFDKTQNKPLKFKGKHIVLSAGALASPHLLLSSGLDKENPAGHLIGKHLMRHVNSIVFGVFPYIADKEQRFHKEIGIMDFYFGHKDHQHLGPKLGSLQQVSTPSPVLIENVLMPPFGAMIGKAAKLITGLLTIAEDQPSINNRIGVELNKKEKYGLLKPYIHHTYSERDKRANEVLNKEAKKIFKSAGAVTSYTHHIKTFSHALGTVRMGADENTSPLDNNCKFRGLNNLFVVDGSVFPTSAAVNPSLTISANALRVGQYILDNE